MASTQKDLHPVQFVFFKTRPSVSSDIFQESWIPVAKSFLLRGIKAIVLSESCSPWNGSFSFISKNVWDSHTAIKDTFGNKGLPAPTNNTGPIEAVQAGCFHIASYHCTGELIVQRHFKMVKSSVKVLALLPVMSTNPALHEVEQDAEILSSLSGYQSKVIYELDQISQPSADTFWFYSWVIELYFAVEDSLQLAKNVEQISAKLQHKWELDIHRDNVQLMP